MQKHILVVEDDAVLTRVLNLPDLMALDRPRVKGGMRRARLATDRLTMGDVISDVARQTGSLDRIDLHVTHCPSFIHTVHGDRHTLTPEGSSPIPEAN